LYFSILTHDVLLTIPNSPWCPSTIWSSIVLWPRCHHRHRVNENVSIISW
jgi:hypothetical protein